MNEIERLATLLGQAIARADDKLAAVKRASEALNTTLPSEVASVDWRLSGVDRRIRQTYRESVEATEACDG